LVLGDGIQPDGHERHPFESSSTRSPPHCKETHATVQNERLKHRRRGAGLHGEPLEFHFRGGMPVEVEFGSASWSPRGAVAGDLPLSRAPAPAPAAHAPPQRHALGRYRLRDDSPTRGLVHGTAPFAAVVLEHGPNSVFTRTGALAPGRRGTVAVSPAGHDRGLCAGGVLLAAFFLPAVSASSAVAEDGVALFESYPSELEVEPLNEASRIEAADGSL